MIWSLVTIYVIDIMPIQSTQKIVKLDKFTCTEKFLH